MRPSFLNIHLLLVLSACSSITSKQNFAQREIASLKDFGSFCAGLFGFKSNALWGRQFQPGSAVGSVHIGIDPRSLIPTKNLSLLDSERLLKAEKYGRDQSIEINTLGFVLDGNHRLLNALKERRSVDVVVKTQDTSLSSRDLLRSPLVIGGQQIASALELSHFKKSYLDGQIPYVVAFKNRDAELTLAHFLSLPQATQHVFLNFLRIQKESAHSQKLEQNFENLSGFSLRNTFWNNLLELQKSKEELEASLIDFQKLAPNEQRTWFEKASQWSRRTRVQDEWQKYYFAKLPLNVDGKKVSVQIKEHKLEGFIRGSEVILNVPTSLIRHPAWNPLDHLERVAANTYSGPREYKVNLDLDGYFYLFDGNHRFAIYGARKTHVKVKTFLRTVDGKPYLFTSPLRNCLDDWGHSQPSIEELEKLSSKEITPQSIVHPNLRGQLLPISELP